MSVFELSGRKALVTGGAKARRGMARALADAGATVVIADLQEEAGKAVAKGLGEQHGFVALDVTSDEGWESAMRDRICGVKAPKQVLVWEDLPRSKVGYVLKTDIRSALVEEAAPATVSKPGD